MKLLRDIPVDKAEKRLRMRAADSFWRVFARLINESLLFEQRCSCGWCPGDYHFWQFAWTDGNVARQSQHNTVNISVNTSYVELCTKQIFQRLYTL